MLACGREASCRLGLSLRLSDRLPCFTLTLSPQPRNLPTARITRSSLSQQLTLPASTVWLVPILFQLFRLLAIVPAVFGTLWNLYHVFRPPDGLNEWRVDYSVSVLWVCRSSALGMSS